MTPGRCRGKACRSIDRQIRTLHYRFVFRILLFYLTWILLNLEPSYLGTQAVSDKSGLIHHSLRGRVLSVDNHHPEHIKVHLSAAGGREIGEKTLGYDGTFAFEELMSGSYLLTIERENAPTIARPLEIKGYSTSMTVFLEVKVASDSSATISETVKEYTRQEHKGREESPTPVPSRAARDFQKASEESSKGNHLKAAEYLEKAIREEPKYFEAYNNLGVQYQRLGRPEKAIQAFRRAIELRDDTAKPHINLGNIYLELGQIQPAIESFKSALQFDENSTVAHLALGQVYFQKHDYETAREHLEMATRLNPGKTRNAFLLLIELEMMNKEYQRARQILDAFLTYHPADPEGLKLKKELDGKE